LLKNRLAARPEHEGTADIQSFGDSLVILGSNRFDAYRSLRRTWL